MAWPLGFGWLRNSSSESEPTVRSAVHTWRWRIAGIWPSRSGAARRTGSFCCAPQSSTVEKENNKIILLNHIQILKNTFKSTNIHRHIRTRLNIVLRHKQILEQHLNVQLQRFVLRQHTAALRHAQKVPAKVHRRRRQIDPRVARHLRFHIDAHRLHVDQRFAQPRCRLQIVRLPDLLGATDSLDEADARLLDDLLEAVAQQAFHVVGEVETDVGELRGKRDLVEILFF